MCVCVCGGPDLGPAFCHAQDWQLVVLKNWPEVIQGIESGMAACKASSLLHVLFFSP